MKNKNNLLIPTASRRQFIGTACVAGAALTTGFIPTKTVVQPIHPLCVFSKHLQWLSVPDMAKAAADLGFDGVDLTVRKGGHVDPTRVTTDLPRAVETIQKAGLSVPMIATDVICGRLAEVISKLQDESRRARSDRLGNPSTVPYLGF